MDNSGRLMVPKLHGHPTGSFEMHDPFAGGRRLARQVLRAQALATALAAAAALAVSGSPLVAAGVAWGGGAVMAGAWMFARRQMAGVASATTLLRRFYGAAAWKWLVLFALYALGIVALGLPAVSMLAGLLAAQAAGTWALIRYA
jgi:hypothetical protein